MTASQNNVPVLRFKDRQGNSYPLWAKKKLASIGKFIGGGTPDTSIKKYWKGDIPWISSADIDDGDINNINIHRYVTEEALQISATNKVPKNSVIFATRVGIGKIAVAKSEICISQDFTSLILKNDLSSFIGYLFQSNKNLISKYNQGTSIKGITSKDLKNITVRLPILQEQQKIASFLSSVDIKIERLGKKKTLLKQYKKGIMQKLFSQEIRFKDEQGNDYLDWEGNTLGMLFEISAGGDIENSHSRKNKDGIFRYPIYANSEKEKGLHGYSDRYSVKQNCITVSGRGTLGVAHARFEKFFPIVRLLVLIPRKESNLIFFEHAINLLQIFKESTGVPQLTAPQLKKYHLNYPSIKEQQKIANFLSAIDKKIELVAEQLEQARTYKKGLLQQMFI